MGVWSDAPAWQKALLIGGGVTTVGGLLWYVFRETEEENEEEIGVDKLAATLKAAAQKKDKASLVAAIAEANQVSFKGQELHTAKVAFFELDAPAEGYYKVLETSGANVGLRVGPDTGSEKAGGVLFPGEVFGVSEVIDAAADQEYYKLADNRGYVFRTSARDGRLLITKSSSEEMALFDSSKLRATAAVMEQMQQATAGGARDEQLWQQMLAEPQLHAALNDPNFLHYVMQQPGAAAALGIQP